MAYIVVAKYQDALPLYRMETIFKRLAIHLPRSTQANWMIKGAELFQPLYNLFNDRLLSSGYMHMDLIYANLRALFTQLPSCKTVKDYYCPGTLSFKLH